MAWWEGDAGWMRWMHALDEAWVFRMDPLDVSACMVLLLAAHLIGWCAEGWSLAGPCCLMSVKSAPVKGSG